MDQKVFVSTSPENESESESDPEFLMTKKTLDVIHPEVVLAVPICSGSKQYKVFEPWLVLVQWVP